MKTIKLNSTWSATRFDDGKVFVHWHGFTNEFDRIDCGRAITRKMVARVLRLKRGTILTLPPPGRPERRWTYDFARKTNYIQIGCQKFYLTRIKKLLSLFS